MQDAFGSAQNKAGYHADQAKDQGKGLFETAQDKAGSFLGTAQDKAGEAQNKAGYHADQAKDQGKGLFETAQDKASSFLGTAQDKAEGAKHDAKVLHCMGCSRACRSCASSKVRVVPAM